MSEVVTLSADEIQMLTDAEKINLKIYTPADMAMVPLVANEFRRDLPELSDVAIAKVIIQMSRRTIQAAQMLMQHDESHERDLAKCIGGALAAARIEAITTVNMAVACHLTMHVRGKLN